MKIEQPYLVRITAEGMEIAIEFTYQEIVNSGLSIHLMDGDHNTVAYIHDPQLNKCIIRKNFDYKK